MEKEAAADELEGTPLIIALDGDLEARSEDIWNKYGTMLIWQPEAEIGGTPEKPEERWAGQKKSNFFISGGE